jgi:beta-N-acetylhexosaminidase
MHRRTALTALTLGLHSAATFGQRRAAEPPAPPELLAMAGRCLLVGWRARGVNPWAARRIAEGGLGAVILTRANAPTAAALRALTTELNALLPAGAPPLVVASDQEGGAVSHLSPPLVRLPSFTTLGAIDDVALTARVGAALGRSLLDAGVTMNLAPVLDVSTHPSNGVVPGRVFGRDPDKVARHGEAFVRALQAAGVLACAKHFPGHGGTREDSHQVLPHVAATVESLRRVELVPFAAVASSAAAVMIAHVVYDGVDRDFPASLSARCATELLRDVAGMRGVAVTDDLEMTPIRTTWGVPAAAVRAIAAGSDLATVAHSPAEAENARQAIARRAAVDEAFRARLTQADERVRALRARVVVPESPGPAEDVVTLLREVHARSPRRAAVFRDPTL